MTDSPTFDFSEALKHMKSGAKLRRKSWEIKGFWAQVRNGKLILNYAIDAELWYPEVDEIMAEDWYIA